MKERFNDKWTNLIALLFLEPWFHILFKVGQERGGDRSKESGRGWGRGRGEGEWGGRNDTMQSFQLTD